MLRGAAGMTRVVITLRATGSVTSDGTRVHIGVARRDAVSGVMDEPIGLAAAVAADRWSDVEVPLARPAVDGEHLLVNVTVAEPGRAVAVRKIALS